MKKEIFIEYETKNREFDGNLLLISNLMAHGFDKIYFGSQSFIRKLALKKKDGIYFFKSVSLTEMQFYEKLKQNGFTFILLHAEGGIYYKDYTDSIKSFFNKQASRFISYNFLFGELIKNSIESLGLKNHDQQLVVSGNPRFDLLKKKYDKFFENETKEIITKYKEFILINTSFSTGNPEAGVETLRNFFVNEPTFTQEIKDSLLFKMEFFKGVADSFIEAIAHLAHIFHNKHFIVRTHPSESEYIYKSRLKSFANITVTKEGNVVQWIKASKGVIHFDCTTGVEALIAGKPVLSYLPYYDEKAVAWLPPEISKKVYSIDDLQKQVKLIFDENFEHKIDSQKQEILQSVMHNFRYESSPIIAHTLTSDTNLTQSYADRNSYFLSCFIHNGKTFIKKMIRRHDGAFRVAQLKKGTFRSDEIQFKLANLLQIQNIDIKFLVRKLTVDCVEIVKINNL